jgi:hypothetical protein
MNRSALGNYSKQQESSTSLIEKSFPNNQSNNNNKIYVQVNQTPKPEPALSRKAYNDNAANRVSKSSLANKNYRYSYLEPTGSIIK